MRLVLIPKASHGFASSRATRVNGLVERYERRTEYWYSLFLEREQLRSTKR
jgi:hypothetical protein